MIKKITLRFSETNFKKVKVIFDFLKSSKETGNIIDRERFGNRSKDAFLRCLENIVRIYIRSYIYIYKF